MSNVIAQLDLRTTWHTARDRRTMSCTRLCLGHFSVGVEARSRNSEEIEKLDLRLSMLLLNIAIIIIIIIKTTIKTCDTRCVLC